MALVTPTLPVMQKCMTQFAFKDKLMRLVQYVAKVFLALAETKMARAVAEARKSDQERYNNNWAVC